MTTLGSNSPPPHPLANCTNQFFRLIFNWGIIALQYCVGLCHTSTWISHRYTYVCLENAWQATVHRVSKSRTRWECSHAYAPSHLPRLSKSAGLELPASYSESPLAHCLHTVKACFLAALSVRPTLSLPHCVHKSFPYICICIAALKIGSLVPPF